MFAASSLQQGTVQGCVLISALGWFQDLLLESVGSVLAVIAIAGLGFAMLQGRLSPRKGIKVVLGCFILFGAPALAKGLADLAHFSTTPSIRSIEMTPAPPATAPSPPAPNPDPYAGPSVPM